VKNRPWFNNTAIWIGLLSVLLVGFNFIAFLIHKGANPGEILSVQLWNYLESATFKVITISLVLPIIMFVLEKRFKIVETVRQNQHLKELKEEEERKEKRWECIEQTSKIWNQLWDLTSEIIYFKKDADTGTAIKDLLIRLRNFTTSTEEVINMWSHRFPNLPAKYEESFLVFFNTELNSAETVAWCIHHGDNAEEVRKMQDSLKRIVESINYLVHHNLIDVLKYSMELLELKEANAPEDEQQDMISLIDERAANLKDWANAIETEEYRHNKLFSFVDTADVEAFRDAYRKFTDWLLINPDKTPVDAEEYDNLKRLFYKIPHEQAGPYFSREFVIYLANWLGFECRRAKLMNWVKGQY
jgi:hypothetical protein